MKRIYFAFLIFWMNSVCIGQTYISGFISANTIWDIAGSPYIITGNALLEHGYTLTINPGVIIKFNLDKALQIDGELIAIGTPGNKITFTSNQINPVNGDWAKIHFPDTCVDAVLDSNDNYISGTILKYCDILYSGGLGFGAIHINRSSPYLSHCMISQSESSGIYADDSYYRIDSSTVSNCEDYGIYWGSLNLVSSDIDVINVEIINNLTGGMFFYGMGGIVPHYFNIINCVFYNNQSTGAIRFGSNPMINFKIENNLFELNSGIGTITSGSSLTNLSIWCNTFISNTGKIIYCPSNQIFTGSIIDNIFDSNSGMDNVLEVYNHSSTQNTYILQNTFKNNNTSQSILKIGPQMSNNSYLTQIEYNNFTNNTSSSTIKISPVFPPSGSFNFIRVMNNNFDNPLTQYELYNNIPYGSPNLHVENNFWGSNNLQHVDSVIYDYFDFANLSVVYYQPILNIPLLIDTVCNPIQTNLVDFQNSPENVSIYPNPCNSFININSKLYGARLELELYDLKGVRYLHESMSGKQEFSFDVRLLKNGIYILRVYNESISLNKKVIIQH